VLRLLPVKGRVLSVAAVALPLGAEICAAPWPGLHARVQVQEMSGSRQVTFYLDGCSIELSSARTAADAPSGADAPDTDSQAPCVHVEVVRQSNRLDAQDLALLARVMQLSNDTSLKIRAVRDPTQPLPSSSPSPLWLGSPASQRIVQCPSQERACEELRTCRTPSLDAGGE